MSFILNNVVNLHLGKYIGLDRLDEILYLFNAVGKYSFSLNNFFTLTNINVNVNTTISGGTDDYMNIHGTYYTEDVQDALINNMSIFGLNKDRHSPSGHGEHTDTIDIASSNNLYYSDYENGDSTPFQNVTLLTTDSNFPEVVAGLNQANVDGVDIDGDTVLDFEPTNDVEWKDGYFNNYIDFIDETKRTRLPIMIIKPLIPMFDDLGLDMKEELGVLEY